MARRSTGACPACSRHSVQPRQAVWEGLQGQSGPPRTRLRAQYYHDYLLSNRAADGGLVRRAARRQAAPHPSDSICCLASLAATASGSLRRPPRFASAAYDCGTHVGSPPASPAAGPHSAPLVGGVPRRLRSTGCLAQTAADAARGRCRRCCRAPALWASPSCPEYVADATCRSPLPWTSLPSGKHTHTHTHTSTHTINNRVIIINY